MPKQKQSVHVPVLLEDVLKYLNPANGESYLDLTAGYGGHASAILSHTRSRAVLVDRDENAVLSLNQRFEDDTRVEVLHDDFLHASTMLMNKEEKFDLIVADLGVSSPHLDNAARGFSIQDSGPLDMRMDQRQELTAMSIVNSFNQAEIARILRTYGEEPKAKRIAQLMVEHRTIETTQELAEIVRKAWPYGSRVHPATRTFQAIRIVVNDELGQLEASIPMWHKLLKPGGRLAIISFHSLEDALVKRYFREHGGERYDADLQILTKKPVTASPDELVHNPRSRSARLRAVAKNKNKTKLNRKG